MLFNIWIQFQLKLSADSKQSNDIQKAIFINSRVANFDQVISHFVSVGNESLFVGWKLS